MKISFMTLGCPNWNLETICQRGREYGFNGVDFRGYLDTIDITTRSEFTTDDASTKRLLSDAGLEVSAISSSIIVCDPSKNDANVEEARRTIPVAKALGAERVRVFGGGDLAAHPRTELAKIGCDCVEAILALDGARDLKWMFEMHDIWVDAPNCKLLLDAIPEPAFGCLWDIGHTTRIGTETPAQTYAALRDRITYTHIKDAIYEPKHELALEDGWRYVLPGEGQLPLADAVRLLKTNGYDSWYQFEHEKRWHKELQEPEIAFPAFAKWIREVLRRDRSESR